MRMAVLGAGSIGLLLSGRLAEAGANVTLLCRTEAQAQRIAADGVEVRAADGVAKRIRLPAAPAVRRDGTAFAAARPADWVLLAFKQTHWDDALLAALAHAAASGAKLVCFQNGLGHLERLAAAGVPPERTYVAVTTEAARREAANVVTHTGAGTTRLGSADRSAPLDALRPLAERLAAAGFAVAVEPDIARFVWRKLLVNAAINPLTALFGVRNGELAASKPYRRIMRAVLGEALAVAEAAGLEPEPEADAWRQVLDVCARTAANDSSMLQDVRAGRETEIESITGALLREAAARGVPAPVNEAVYRLVKACSERQAGRG
ncbi:2-dehydropantoate 2-reductase [Paenibacillus sp.]|uniref:ketopantoate reductase family protein n=1 Tax=Paenibacillus sp. TaxID=58172 RepID=UPI002D430C49|nr:2-dehydropantoate 2-reductase [Paenibacillus sp.]HZG56713.1 2-dehydropantoate 2-reductase [Paenibacillus sp.]